VIRTIDGFHQDAEGDWVAELSCLHNQHVRHRPPFFDRPWVTTSAGREERLGTELDCPLCDRAELPDGLRLVRTAGPFDGDTVPAALTRDHRVAERTWACLRVLEGTVTFRMATDPPTARTLRAGESQAIPPSVVHSVALADGTRFAVDFLTLQNPLDQGRTPRTSPE
jgi:tellurite methyltransferase